MGAGASKSGNIPLANEIAESISQSHSGNPAIKGLKKEERSYAKLMDCLQPFARNDVLKGYIDQAKINVAHIYLAQLMTEGFVDYVLTVNFDNLMLRALALYNVFPPTYDMAVLKDLTTTTFTEKSVVYLHGQHHGAWLLNTGSEMEKVKKTLPRIFDSIKNRRPWVFIGYSGNDPVFDHIKELGRFDNGLYWVGYNNHIPGEHVQTLLKDDGTNAFLIDGYDADSFMVKLNNSLDLEQPRILDKPFTLLGEMLDGINEIDDEDHFQPVRERLAMAKGNVEKARRHYDAGERNETTHEESQLTRLKKTIIQLSLAEEYPEEKVAEVERLAAGFNDSTVDRMLSDLYLDMGNRLGDLARLTSGEAAEALCQRACEKYEKAIEIKPDKHEAFNNWGNRLGDLARLTSGEAAEALCQRACEKYEKAIEIEPDMHLAFYNGGNALGNLAKLTSGEAAEALYQQACEKYEKAIEIKPDKHEAFINWGNALGGLAKLTSGEAAETLYQRACEKFEKAAEIKPDCHEPLTNWGNTLGALAKLTSGEAAEALYQQAYEKYEKAIEIKSDCHETFNNWGTLLGDLAKLTSGEAAEALYHQACEKCEKAIEIKSDYHQAFNNWGNTLLNLAQQASGDLAQELYQRSIETLKKGIEFGGSSYNLACAYALTGNESDAFRLLQHSLVNGEIASDFVVKDDDWKIWRENETFIEILSRL